jgi:hypothetical protein
MDDSIDKLTSAIKTELSVVWSCLIYYEQWFGSEHDSERKLLLAELPGFFPLQQRLLLDAALSGLSRLLENSETGGGHRNKNLSIDRLIKECEDKLNIPDQVNDSLLSLQQSWRKDDYQILKDFRDHHVAHCDWTTRMDDNPNEFRQPSLEFFHKLKDLFCKVYEILRALYQQIFGSDLLEPTFQAMSMRPERLTTLVAAGKTFFGGDKDPKVIHHLIQFNPVHTLCNREV